MAVYCNDSISCDLGIRYPSSSPSCLGRGITWSLWGWQARGARAGGKEVLDIHLLKPARFLAEGQLVDGDGMLHNEDQAPLEYPYRKAHPILRWLPSNLAEWIAENKGVDLGIAPKQGQKWSVKGLNDILHNNLVECKSQNKG